MEKYHCEQKLIPNSPVDSIQIIEKPIKYSAERIRLSLDYLKIRHGITQTKPTIKPQIIVLHYTSGGTMKSNYDYFNNIYIEKGRVFNKKQSSLNVSAHYLVDRDGKIYHLIQDTLFARHIIGLNYCSIGIENIGGKNAPLTEEQVSANSGLIRFFCKRYSIKYLIGHSEYFKFRESRLWKETNPKYFAQKDDPGDEFLKKIRRRISDLKLKESPEK